MTDRVLSLVLIWICCIGCKTPLLVDPDRSDMIFIGSDYGILFALNAENGKLIWKDEEGVRHLVRSVPTVFNEIVFLSKGTVFKALNARTGEQKWQFTLGTDEYGTASPTLGNGLVYMSYAKITRTQSPDQKAFLRAFDATTGEEVWNFSHTMNFPSDLSPALANGIIYLPPGDSALYAFDARTGQQKWTVG